ncbi:hypothetical protein V5799_033866 [Amblyomma americanum]|uniref:Uncharacterized protein n=1 Tax=Amblyomma americanum TaxID=6943 RepID=A0AAQ4DM32_AMBAM
MSAAGFLEAAVGPHALMENRSYSPHRQSASSSWSLSILLFEEPRNDEWLHLLEGKTWCRYAISAGDRQAGSAEDVLELDLMEHRRDLTVSHRFFAERHLCEFAAPYDREEHADEHQHLTALGVGAGFVVVVQAQCAVVFTEYVLHRPHGEHDHIARLVSSHATARLPRLATELALSTLMFPMRLRLLASVSPGKHFGRHGHQLDDVAVGSRHKAIVVRSLRKAPRQHREDQFLELVLDRVAGRVPCLAVGTVADTPLHPLRPSPSDLAAAEDVQEALARHILQRGDVVVFAVDITGQQ